MSDEALSKMTQAPPKQLKSVAERLNVFQGLESKERAFEYMAREITNHLFILFRSAGLYDLDNQALDHPFESFLKSISGVYELLKTPISLRMNDGNFFVNRRQVKLDFSTFQNARYLIKIFERLEINELCFDPEITRSDLKVLLTTFVRIVKEKRGHFIDVMIPHIQARQLQIGEIHPLLKTADGGEKVVAWYATARFITQNFYQDAAQGRVPEHAQLKRTLIALIELPSSLTPLLGCLHLLPESKEDGGTLFTHSVEAAGLTQVIAESLQLGYEAKLSIATAAIQLFQGWTLLSDGVIDYNSPQATKRVFESLESSAEHLRTSRNEIVRTLLNLGGMSESVITRAVITYEAQRGMNTAWDSADSSRGRSGKALARPMRAADHRRLYPNGLGRSFLTDIVYGAHLYVYLRREFGEVEAMSRLRKASLLPEMKEALYESIGTLATSSAVELTDGRIAVVTQCKGDQVSAVAVVERGNDIRRIRIAEQFPIRPTTPVQVKRPLNQEEQREKLSWEARRSILFSRYAYREST
jgi:hypothetical protein